METNGTTSKSLNQMFADMPDDTMVMVRKGDLGDRWIKLITEAAKLGHMVFVRYDRFRTQKMYTVLVDNARLTDTDDPIGAVQMYLNDLKSGKNIDLF